MTDLDIFGPTLVPTQIGDAITLTLQTWLPDYLDWICREIGQTPGWLPLPNSYVVTDDADHWPEDEPPAVVVVVPGTDSLPKMNGDGIYRAEWLVSVTTFVTAGDRASTERLAKYYAAAIRTLLTQKGELGGVATFTQWRGEKYDARLNDRVQRTLGASEVKVCVDIQQAAKGRGGPLSPSANPTQPPADWPQAKTVTTTLTAQPPI